MRAQQIPHGWWVDFKIGSNQKSVLTPTYGTTFAQFNSTFRHYLNTNPWLQKNFNSTMSASHLYILGLSVRLFVSNKHQNGWTDQVQIMCETLHGPMKAKPRLQKVVSKSEIKKLCDSFFKSELFFVIVLYCTKKR